MLVAMSCSCGPTDVWDARVECEPTGVFGGVCIQGVRGGEGDSSDSFISSPSGGFLVGSGWQRW